MQVGWRPRHDENSVDTISTWNALRDECRHDGTPIMRFNWLLDEAISVHPQCNLVQGGRNPAEQAFSTWRGHGGS